ncbi:MAG: hypothetical protein ABIQ60_04385 [Burkholderiaceae bacterium]
MVTPHATRPAPLTQRQVDEFVGGRHAGVASVLHLARSEPPATARAAATGSSPVAVSVDELASIARGGSVPEAVAKRLSAAPTGKNGEPKGRAKSKAAQATTAARDAGSKPSREPRLSRADD